MGLRVHSHVIGRLQRERDIGENTAEGNQERADSYKGIKWKPNERGCNQKTNAVLNTKKSHQT